MKRKQDKVPQETKNKMLKLITGFVLTLQVVGQLTSAAMSLPDGIENILGFVPRSTFQCERDGYFGDIDNDCRIFHLCQKQVNSNGLTVSEFAWQITLFFKEKSPSILNVINK